MRLNFSGSRKVKRGRCFNSVLGVVGTLGTKTYILIVVHPEILFS